MASSRQTDLVVAGRRRIEEEAVVGLVATFIVEEHEE